MTPLHHFHLIRRAAGVLTGFAALLAPAMTAPAAFALPLQPGPPGWDKQPPAPVHLPPLPPGRNKHPPMPGPAHVHATLAGGMAGWQITLVASGAAVLAAVLVTLASPMRASGRRVTATTGKA